jgi:glycosyltransferase involved in cell wall biosynthesis
MKATPLISIILPTFNRAALLPRAIDSVLRQTWENWELVIEDDGSTDGTDVLLSNYAGQDPRIRPYFHPNCGPANSRNLGLKAAFGEYETYIDSDDEYLPDHLLLRIEFLQKHPSIDLIHGGACIIGTPEQRFVPDACNAARRISLDDCVIGGTFFARSGTIERAGGWKDGFAEDACLFDRLASHCNIAKVSFETYIYHRDTTDSRCTEFLRRKSLC